jgi:hypothetical protein
MRQVLIYIYIFTASLFIFGCVSSNQPAPYFATEKGQYTSSFPTRDVSTQLTSIQRSVLRITSTTIYTTYFFDDVDLTLEEIQKADLQEVASKKSTLDQSKAGTAVSILQNNRHIALLTAEHVLFSPDTLISYKQGKNVPQNKFLQSVGIKIKQRNYLHTYHNLLPLYVLAADKDEDLALIRVSVDNVENLIDAPPIALKTGVARNLKVGSFLYVLGYPLGTPMVTRGIVSAPNYDNQGNFLTDALFNHGISGGLIVASRDNFNSFEWVGMSVQASASEQYYLVPDPAKQQAYQNFEVYTDTAFISKRNLINYGVTQATPIEKILRFLYKNEDKLKKFGLSSTNLSGQ